MTVESVAAVPVTVPIRPSRLLVTWQHPVSRSYEAVGLLSDSPGGYAFRYLSRAATVSDFQTLPGFPERDRRYTSTRLFPLFAQRIMNERRPDYSTWLDALGLESGVSSWEILARSQGHRVGDEIRVFPEPEVTGSGASATSFFVHGLRHRLLADPTVEPLLAQLSPGDALELAPEPTNPVNPHAVHVAGSGVPIGWVPDVLADYAQALLDCGTPSAVVQHVNGLAVPPNYRLLVRVSGSVQPGYRPFDQFLTPEDC